jgi:hypothetical protein
MVGTYGIYIYFFVFFFLTGRMTPSVPEELNAIVRVRLFEIIKVGGETTEEKVIFEGKGTDTGLEVVGDVEKFVAKAEPQRPS